jgi:Ca-activated chloride channel family protein
LNDLLANFHFLRPVWLLGVLAVIPAAVLAWRRLRSGQAWNAVINESLLPHLLSGRGSRPARWPVAMLCLAWLVASLALAGPSWQKLPQPVERKEDALVVVLDLSASMYAQDIAPSRLIRSRQKILDLLGRKVEGTTGLVAYAGDAHVVSPLTDDLRTVANLLPALEPNIMPVKGSEPAPAIEQAVRLLRDSGLDHGQILLVTDGIRDRDSKAIARILAGSAYRLSVLGVGTGDGAPIPTGDGFLRDAEGTIVVAGLDSQPLSALAGRFGGYYSDIQLGDSDIEQILDTDVWGEPASEQVLDRSVDTWQDMGYWLLLLLVPVALAAFRRGWLLCILFLPFHEPAAAQDWRSFFLNSDQLGSRLLNEGEAAAAAEAFENPDWAAAANYRAGNYQDALEHYRRGDDANSWYNRGNALARAGRLEEAISAYDEALKRRDDMEDAAFNKALLEQLLEQQQNQEQSGQDSQQDQQQQQDSDQQQASGQQGCEDPGTPADEQRGGDTRPEQDPGEEQVDPQRAQQQSDEQPGAEAQPQNTGQDGADDAGQQALAQRDDEDIEREMANEQWLRRIPDDPSGLLRRKLLYESRLRASENPENARKGQDEETW